MARTGRALPGFGYAVLCASLVAAACASVPPPRPITSLEMIAGRWAGIASLDRRYLHWWVTIGHDGRLIVEYADVTLWGTVTVRDGRATYSAAHTSGELRLYGDGYQRVLEMRDNIGTLKVDMQELRPQ